MRHVQKIKESKAFLSTLEKRTLLIFMLYATKNVGRSLPFLNQALINWDMGGQVGQRWFLEKLIEQVKFAIVKSKCWYADPWE